jgi:hypothetical protein
MNCVICDQEGHAVSALAICQRCGGGACRVHLEILCAPSAPSGMAGMHAPRREHVCQRCLKQDGLQQTSRRGKSKGREAGLPDAREAVQAAEALLFRKRQATRSWPAALWQRIWQWRLGRMSTGQPKEEARLPRS